MKENTRIVIIIVIVGIAVSPIFFFTIMSFVFRVPDSGCEGVTILSVPVSGVDKFKNTDNTFTKSYFGKGNDKVYRVTVGAWDTRLCIPIKHADYNTFEVLSVNYAKDKNNAYFLYSGIKKRAYKSQYTIFDIDNESFVILAGNKYYSKDKNHNYFKTQIIKDEPSYDRAKVLDGSSPRSH